MDRLPKEVILDILYHTEMKLGVRSCLLYSEFKDLWKENPRIQFHVLQDEDSTAASDFINHALLLWKGTRVLEFKIIFEKFDEKLKRELDVWLLFARENKVRDLYLELKVNDRIPIRENTVYKLPSLFQKYELLKNIVLIGIDMEDTEEVFWRGLERLRIVGKFQQNCIEKLLLMNENLKEVVLQQWGDDQNFTIRSGSRNLLKLRLDSSGRKLDGSNTGRLVISVENLKSLTLEGSAYETCTIDVPELEEACFSLGDRFSVILGSCLSSLMRKVPSVQKVTLSAHCVKVLVLMEERYSFQSLPSVKFLRLHTASISPKEFRGLVQLFYNLEDIAIDWTVGDMWTSFHDYTLPPRPLEDGYRYEYLEGDLLVIRNCISRLKTVRLDWHFFDDAQPRLVRFLLKNCAELSKVDIVNMRKGLEDYDEDVADMLAAMWDMKHRFGDVIEMKNFETVGVIFE